MDQSDLFTVNDLLVKFKSKLELINVLSREKYLFASKERCNTKVFEKFITWRKAICKVKGSDYH